MSDIAKRIAALTPEQRALLERRLKQKGLDDLIVPGAIQSASQSSAVPYAQREPDLTPVVESPRPGKALPFSLFFFSDNGATTGDDKYRLLIEAARFADEHGFAAVSVPERHFQAFGGLYPNPSVLGAALAMITRRVQIRAGSVALPLHNPIRVAEEWSVVDNLSKGRVAVSMASGWHPRDFVFAPTAYDDRRALMFEYIQLIQRLWAGETITVPGVQGVEEHITLVPRPIQPKLPIWITTTGTVETWRRAGEIGANILATLINQSFDDLRQRIALYRETLARHGHDPHQGCVTVMLHTFVGEDNAAIKALVHAPLRQYLRSFVAQFKTIMTQDIGVDINSITERDEDVILSFACDRYFETSSLLGTPEKCMRVLDRLGTIGVDEIACLIDFGLDVDMVMSGLQHLDRLRAAYCREVVE
jgi:natural product biosynthesis luciferase-like monooxygenase protein